MTPPEIDVVILTWNDGPLLERAIHSAIQSEDVRVFVYVVDNGSSPAASILDAADVKLIRSDTNLGVSQGRNRGVRAGGSPLVCLLDSDAVLHPGTLKGLARSLEDPTVGLAGPVFSGQRPEESGGTAPTLGRKLERLLGRTSAYGATRSEGADVWDVDFVIGACQLFRREAYDAIDGIDERWFYGPEDADFCMRMRNIGWRVIQCGGVPCDHPARRRNRRILTRRGIAHAKAVLEFVWRHRSYKGVSS